MQINEKYVIDIYERYSDLKKSKKEDYDYNDLWKIFEYFSCIKLTNEFGKQFYEYDDISPNFKEENNLTKNDTGIDCCDLIDTIVQCKLRSDTLTLKECATFFASQNIYCNKEKKYMIRWDNLVITRNDKCTISKNLASKFFVDRKFRKKEIIEYCENLIKNPPKYPVIVENFELRDYQKECIDLIQKQKKNIIISLPTGTGKNVIIIHSLEKNKKYLILVPRIILME